jgi:hypothetical protein
MWRKQARTEEKRIETARERKERANPDIHSHVCSTLSCFLFVLSLILIHTSLTSIMITPKDNCVSSLLYFSLLCILIASLSSLILPFLRIGCIWPRSQGGLDEVNDLFLRDWREIMMNSIHSGPLFKTDEKPLFLHL